jgi:hypothetical protein
LDVGRVRVHVATTHIVLLEGALTTFGLIITFCRDFMHIVLVHYLEVKVIPNHTLIHMYLAACPLLTGFHHPKCCILEKNYVNSFFTSGYCLLPFVIVTTRVFS